MNIGIFTDTYYPNVNGVVRSIETLRENLEKLGHTVYIITNGKVDYEERNVHRIGTLPVEILEGYKIALPYSYKIFKSIKKLKLDIIHTHTEWSVGIFGRICATRLKIPYIHTFHTMYENYTHYMAKFKGERISKKLLKQIIKSHCNKTNGVIAPSLKAKNTLTEYGVKRTIYITPTGIDLNKFKAEISEEDILAEKEKLGIKPDDFVGLYLGRLAKEKNIEPIIQAVKSVDRDNFKFLIVGGGPERDNLENLARELKVSDKIIFAGEKDLNEVPLYYNIGDLFIQSSKTETQGLTIFETMAAGTPLLVRHDTNISNFFSDEVECAYYNEDYEIPLKILKLIDNRPLLESMKKNATEKIQEFSDEKFGMKVEGIYLRAVRKNEKKRKMKMRKYIIKLK